MCGLKIGEEKSKQTKELGKEEGEEYVEYIWMDHKMQSWIINLRKSDKLGEVICTNRLRQLGGVGKKSVKRAEQVNRKNPVE